MGWKHNDFSVCSLPAHQDILPWRQKTFFYGSMSFRATSQQKPARHHFSEIYLESHGRQMPKWQRPKLLVTALLVSLQNLKYHVWFAATKGTCHPPTFCLLCMLYAKNMRSHHIAYRIDTRRYRVYMQEKWSVFLLSTQQRKFAFEQVTFGFWDKLSTGSAWANTFEAYLQGFLDLELFTETSVNREKNGLCDLQRSTVMSLTPANNLKPKTIQFTKWLINHQNICFLVIMFSGAPLNY